MLQVLVAHVHGGGALGYAREVLQVLVKAMREGQRSWLCPRSATSLEILAEHMREGWRSRRRLRNVQALAEHKFVALRAVTNDGGIFSHLTCNYANRASLIGRALRAAVQKAPQTPFETGLWWMVETGCRGTKEKNCREQKKPLPTAYRVWLFSQHKELDRDRSLCVTAVEHVLRACLVGLLAFANPTRAT